MAREVIATIRLNPGRVGFYDEYSGIYLTQSNPVKDVYAGTNCTQLARGVRSGVLKLVSGTLNVKTGKDVIAEIVAKKRGLPKGGLVNMVATIEGLDDSKFPEVDITAGEEIEASSVLIDTHIEMSIVEPEEAVETVLSTMKISPSYISKLAIGETRTVATDADALVTYSSEDETIATIDSEGVVTGISAGKTYIVAKAEGYEDKRASVTVIEAV